MKRRGQFSSVTARKEVGMFGLRSALVGIRRSRVLQLSLSGFSDCAKVFSGSITARACSGKIAKDEWIEDFNKELELVFGSQTQSPSQIGETQISRGIVERGILQQAAPASNQHVDTDDVVRVDSLSHVDAAGKAAMVNVADKTVSKRVAVASGKVFLGSKAFDLVAANKVVKGDVLTVAKIAGIHGAKQTSSLIPLCHNILLSGIVVSLTLEEDLHAVSIRAEATTSGPTGVEMEALTAVSVASLTVYDMCKAVSKDIRISNIQLESKTGGKSGDWFRY